MAESPLVKSSAIAFTGLLFPRFPLVARALLGKGADQSSRLFIEGAQKGPLSNRSDHSKVLDTYWPFPPVQHSLYLLSSSRSFSKENQISLYILPTSNYQPHLTPT
jgi:hypothetical protein